MTVRLCCHCGTRANFARRGTGWWCPSCQLVLHPCKGCAEKWRKREVAAVQRKVAETTTVPEPVGEDAGEIETRILMATLRRIGVLDPEEVTR